MMLLQLSIVALVSSAAAETILGVVVYTRHGDRTAKHYPNYALTNLGFQQNLQVGSDYRDLYISGNASKRILGISEDRYNASQIYAAAPDEPLLLNTATAFVQGLYPSLNGTPETLDNSTTYPDPISAVINTEASDSPNAIWIRGNNNCPGVTEAEEASISYLPYREKLNATHSFYQKLWPVLENISDYNRSSLSYDNAYDIFDLINVGMIHNESNSLHNGSLRDSVTADDLFQLRTLADSHEFELNYDPINNAPYTLVGARALMAAIKAQLKAAVSGTTKFTLLAGDYDLMLGLFGFYGITGASDDFYGLPEYASTMAFELLTEENVTSTNFSPTDESALKVRFLFRNGSSPDAELTPFPIIGPTGTLNSTTVPWSEFTMEMIDLVDSNNAWCTACQSEEDFCQIIRADDGWRPRYDKPRMSNAVAGVIGSMVTLGVLAVFAAGAAAAFLFLRRRLAKTAPTGIALQTGPARKGSLGSLNI
ncbi:histidine phosphatase superfamily [Aspergillus varians]